MNPVFCKYSGDRAARFRIKTVICMEEDGTKTVRKYPLVKEAQDHVDGLYRHFLQMEESFAGTLFVPNRCRKLEKGVEFEFVEGETLEHYLDGLYQKGRYLDIVEEIKKYRDLLYTLSDNIPFQYTEAFDEVFGKNTRFMDCRSLKISNIDLIFGNLLLGERWTILDYEWILDFPVPVEYIVYRAVHYYLHGSTKRDGLLDLHIFRLLGISDGDLSMYGEMEENFQKYVAGNQNTLSELKKTMLRPRIPARDMLLAGRMETLQLYFDDGKGFCEEHSLKKTYFYQEQEIEVQAQLPEGTKRLRIDPAASAAIIRGLRISDEEKELVPEESNGLRLEDGTYVFGTEDPQLILGRAEGIRTVTVSFFAEAMAGAWKKELMALTASCRDLQEEKKALSVRNDALSAENEQMKQYLDRLRGRLWWRFFAKGKQILKGSKGR